MFVGLVLLAFLLNVWDEHTTRVSFRTAALRDGAAGQRAPAVPGALVPLGVAAELSAVAYAAQFRPTELLAWSCAACPQNLGFELVQDFFYRPSNVFGFVARSKGEGGDILHVVFRGVYRLHVFSDLLH